MKNVPAVCSLISFDQHDKRGWRLAKSTKLQDKYDIDRFTFGKQQQHENACHCTRQLWMGIKQMKTLNINKSLFSSSKSAQICKYSCHFTSAHFKDTDSKAPAW